MKRFSTQYHPMGVWASAHLQRVQPGVRRGEVKPVLVLPLKPDEAEANSSEEEQSGHLNAETEAKRQEHGKSEVKRSTIHRNHERTR
jgi:hypothetical protein